MKRFSIHATQFSEDAAGRVQRREVRRYFNDEAMAADMRKQGVPVKEHSRAAIWLWQLWQRIRLGPGANSTPPPPAA